MAVQLDIHNVGDLLTHYPRRYAERGQLTDLSSLRVGDRVTILAQVRSVSQRRMRQRRGTITDVVVGDGKHTLDLVFFNQAWLGKRLRVGMTGLFAGTIGVRGSRVQLAQPDCELFGDSDPDGDRLAEFEPAGTGDEIERAMSYASSLIAVYPATAKLQSWTIARCVRLVLDALDEDAVPDPMPELLAAKHGLVSLRAAWQYKHLPETRDQIALADRRLIWDEAMLVQLTLARRREAAQVNPAITRPSREGGLRSAFDAALPFRLTAGQVEVGEQISAELGGTRAMNRLLQGEVGSGKTVVALRAMLQTIDAGAQAVFLAPTEVLAMQHLRTIRTLLGPMAIAGEFGAAEAATRVTVLTGSQPAKVRRQALALAAGGEAGIVVGTHALLEEGVQFAELGLVVIDEQHRFGVEQRDALRFRSAAPPHVLVLTATPIPRTVAMTVYGDLETATLREIPAGRAEVSTTVVPTLDKPAWLERVWTRVAEEVAKGGRAFVVCPRIGDVDPPAAKSPKGKGRKQVPLIDDGDPGLLEPPDDPEDGDGPLPEDRRPPMAVLEVAELLRTGPLAGLRLGILHGRLSGEDKDATMRAFADGELDVLVTTTVIEVGVDVPEATAMVILDAERFGVSQLHQLRGRIGRGSEEGVCLLVTDVPAETAARARLEAVAATRDGFELARIDLSTRREGDILGAAQSGRRSGLKLLSLLRDEEIIGEAREEASQLVAADPTLADYPALAEQVDAFSDDDRSSYLEKA